MTDPQITMTNNITHINSIPLTQLIDEWTDRNDSAYNQILLCISPELQTAIDATDIANVTWTLLIKKFESTNPSKISIIRMKYNDYHMLEGQSVSSYLTVMKEFKTQLEKIGETIAASTHAATTLRSLPESWRLIAKTIRMITRDPDVIEEHLEAHEADLTALEMLDQATTAFIAQPKPPQPSTMQPPFQNKGHRPSEMFYNNNPHLPPKPFYHCNNCRKDGHSASRCFAPGGGLVARPIWRNYGSPHNSNMNMLYPLQSCHSSPTTRLSPHLRNNFQPYLLSPPIRKAMT